MDLQLIDKTALVTGAGRGIGRAIALRLAREGACVVVNDLSGDTAQHTVDEIVSEGGRAIAVPADVSDSSEVESMVETAWDWHDGLDVLVNNAGIVSRKGLLQLNQEEWRRVLAVNLDGTFYCSQAVAKRMVVSHRQGRIVNISSIHGQLAKAETGAYSSSKSGIEGFSRQLAVELGPTGIGVNVVACGAIRTEINPQLYQSTAPEDVALQKAVLRRIPNNRIGDPTEVAAAVAFLSSLACSSYITGTVVYVDGGYSADGTARL